MKLTPQALRHITAVASVLPDDTRSRLLSWLTRHPSDDVPEDIASLILAAITIVAAKIEKSVDSGKLNEDQEAFALNDLGFLNAIGAGLKAARRSQTAAE